MKLSSCLALVLLAAVHASAALAWKTQHVSLRTVPLQRTTATAFEFTNTGDQPVTITSVDTSCDCLEAAASARVIAPGASGRIDARFTIGDRFGLYQRTIIVSTDDGQPPAALVVTLDVPEAATLTPRSLEWKLHGSAAEQTVEIAVTAGLTLEFLNVEPTSDFFTARLETVAAGRSYRLHVTPKNTAEAANAAFRLYAKAGTGQDVLLSAYANVR
jgi:hypothetical protein